jgi:ABC-type Fe3+-siderophore transport system permease subunit
MLKRTVLIQAMGFVGGLATVTLVTALARTLRGGGDVLVLVLAGIVVSALAGAAISQFTRMRKPAEIEIGCVDRDKEVEVFVSGQLATGGARSSTEGGSLQSMARAG